MMLKKFIYILVSIFICNTIAAIDSIDTIAPIDTVAAIDSIDSIPGIGMNTAARFIAEVSNVDRFKSAKALVAFAGTDPNIDQSGQKDGKHLSITSCAIV